jgi:NAD(P)H-quinone oxidoreductase subunit 5
MLEKITLVLLWLIPLLPALTAVWVGWSRQSPAKLARVSVRSLEWTAGIFVVILALLAVQPLSGTEHWLSVRPLSLLMAGLVLLIGWVVVRFSVRYMAGEPRLAFFYRWLLLTLASVLFAVLANHLLLLLLGWMVISLSLHRLLLFYPHRARTVLAAHKKFVIARIGELSLAVGFYILFQHFGTASIDQILM